MTAQVEWVGISDFLGGGEMNGDLTVNLSHFSYSGANPDLQSFCSALPVS